MAPKQVRLKAQQVTRILQRHGFVLISQRGSHQKWRNPDTGKQVIVPYHKGNQLPLGTLTSIIEGSGIPKEQFRL
ncbi:MAG: type II toxin-antitoxin system HicA family toxin [Chloroflexi bacterium]|nr:type II toxin-antitoxin system HicA family toxin [Chloroflexota bacterium]